MMKKNQKGYAILFTVALVSIISLIAIGLSNIAYKQLMLSSTAKDSQIAFFQSDMAAECALYADIKLGLTSISSPFDCGLYNNNPYTIVPGSLGSGFGYKLEIPSLENTSNPCIKINIKKEERNLDLKTYTTVEAKGYNICNPNNIRTVERVIEVNY